MSQKNHSWKRTSNMLQVGGLLVSITWFGLAGCSSGSGGGGSGGQNSAGKTSSGGGQAGSGGSASGSGGSASTGGQSSPNSKDGSAGGSGGSGGSASTGGNTGGGGSANTGGIATGGTASSGGSQGSQDGGAGSSDTSTVPDAGVDRTPDTTPPLPDAGSVGGFCPDDGTVCKIMPFGDSITDGVGSSGGGYRVPLFKIALTDSKNITFVGRNMNGPGTVTVNNQSKSFPQSHEGYSGWTIKDGGGRSGIYGKVDGAIQTNAPHIVLLMIGTNDVDINLDLTNAPSRLGELLDKLITSAPKALIVVAKLVPTTDDTENGRARTYNDGIAPVVQSRISQGKNLKMVDMYSAFTTDTSYKTALMNDKLHPKDTGYEVMAKTWYDAIKSYLR